MDYSSWLQQVPSSLQNDSLWKMAAYRYALFLSDIAWRDVGRLAAESRTLKLASQLYRAIGSIGANFAEGYSRASGRDRARFYEYSLGSARESRTWYYHGRHVLGDSVFEHRAQFLSHIIKLSLTMIPQQRTYGPIVLREDAPDSEESDLANSADSSPHVALLENIPFTDCVST